MATLAVALLALVKVESLCGVGYPPRVKLLVRGTARVALGADALPQQSQLHHVCRAKLCRHARGIRGARLRERQGRCQR
jgi:hypothetical protein